MPQTTQTNCSPPCEAGSVLNIAAYKFVKLENLEALREPLKQICAECDLRGTILLSPEGINLFVAGEPAQVDTFLDSLREWDAFRDLEAKRSFSDKVPFRRMLVRLKKEIIPCGMDTIRPADQTSPKLSARELKQWLDEGRPVRLLDTRNKYEVELGTFAGAEHLSIGHFREFPDAIEQLPEQAKSEPLVMFCTGGIRCEKAGPVMERAGFRQVYQLDGGILKYFEECGEAHYDGACFVFDGRVALDPALQPTGNLLCFACQAVLTADDVSSGQFKFGEYCPHCYEPPEEVRRSAFELRQARIRELATSQPGCTKYDNQRKMFVPRRLAGLTMSEFLSRYQPAIPQARWDEWMARGQILGQDGRACTPERKVREGEAFVHHMPDTIEPAINPHIELVAEDECLVVINKPAPLPMHPGGRFNRNTLLKILQPAFPNEKLRVVHRLDAATTGVALLCRKYRPARRVQQQFAERRVRKEYLARVQGVPDWRHTTCTIPISDGPVESSGRRQADTSGGLPAITEFKFLQHFGDGTSLIRALPQTGRTHQIRIHLAQLGHAIVGDSLYAQGKATQVPAETALQDSPREAWENEPVLCLHARSITLTHPQTDRITTFAVPNPPWANP